MAGRLIPRKGFDKFLDAAAKFSGKNCEFWIAGKADKGDEKSNELVKRIQAADRAGTVKYLGWIENVAEIISSAHVVVLPSTYNEGIPRSLIEALAIGRPIITTDWKGCRETVEVSKKSEFINGVRKGVNGYLVNPLDGEALANAFNQVIELSPEQLEDMAIKSRQLAEQKFDEREIIELYLREVAG